MKYYCILITILLVGCNTPSKQQVENNEEFKETEYILRNNDLPVEIIEAFVPFIGNTFKANDQFNLYYELTILNNRRLPLTLKKVEVCDTRNPLTPIAEFGKEYLETNFRRNGAEKEKNVLKLDGNEFGIINMWLQLGIGDSLAQEVFHRLIFERIKNDGEIVEYRMEVALIEIPDQTEVSLSFPFKKGKWIYGANSHRGSRFITEGKTSYPQRFAIDWLLIDDEGVFAKDDLSKNENWTTYGIELLAVADGVVVDLQDGFEENKPTTGEMAVPITRESIAGNFIMLDIGSNTHVIYAHLIPKSLKVKIGDYVKKGEVIGLLGNSGNSDAPHLHLHLETKNKKALGGQGIPFHFKEFSLLQTYSDEEFEALISLPKIPIENMTPSKRLNELPIGNGIIEF